MKEVASFIIVLIIVCLCVNKCSTKKLDKAYSEGRKSGYSAGYAEIEREYKQKLEAQQTLYEQKIKDQQKVYDKKITDALQEGFITGKKDKQNEVETQLQKTVSEKENKGKWNDVLFDVNN